MSKLGRSRRPARASWRGGAAVLDSSRAATKGRARGARERVCRGAFLAPARSACVRGCAWAGGAGDTRAHRSTPVCTGPHRFASVHAGSHQLTPASSGAPCVAGHLLQDCQAGQLQGRRWGHPPLLSNAGQAGETALKGPLWGATPGCGVDTAYVPVTATATAQHGVCVFSGVLMMPERG